MTLRDWFASRTAQSPPLAGSGKGPEVPDGLWRQCDGCKATLYRDEFAEALYVCPKCKHHHRVTGRERIRQLVDAGSFVELDAKVTGGDPLGFAGAGLPYRERLQEARNASGEAEAVVTGTARLDGVPFAIGAMNFFFLGGSMGAAVGEKLTRLIEHAHRAKLPLLIASASGGARMQEGAISLMQMAKTSAALRLYRDGGGFYVSLLTDPTTGGVTASFAFLGDLILAEPKALVGFAGRRVIEQTIRQKLPEDFQTAEYLLAHGLIDAIVGRDALRATYGRLLAAHGFRPLADVAPPAPGTVAV